MSRNAEQGAEGPERDGAPTRPGNEGATRLLFGRISGVLGAILAVVGTVSILAAESATVSAGALGIAFGVLGHSLGARRLGAVTLALSALALFLGIAASGGLFPGIGPADRVLPAAELRPE